MIPVPVPGNDLSWYLDLLRNDGMCCTSWKSWSGRLHEKGVFWEERKSWSEWKKLFLTSSGIAAFCWKPQTWERHEKLLAKTPGLDLNRAEPWKYWHQAVHAAQYRDRRREKWKKWGEKLKSCGLEALLPDVPETLDSDPDVALTEKLFLARYPAVLAVKEYTDELFKLGGEAYSRLKGLGGELCNEYGRFSEKEISSEIQKRLNVRTCPYCNSHYLEPRINYKTGRIHPGMQIDHFYPKERYEILSVSLFNLVPSCAYCNHEKAGNDMKVSVYNGNGLECDRVVFRYELTPPDNVDFLINKRVSLYLQVNRHEGAALETARDMLADVSDVLNLAKRTKEEPDRVRYYHGLQVVEDLLERARDYPFERRQLFGGFERLIKFGEPVRSEEEERQAWYRLVFEEWHGEKRTDFLERPYAKLRSDIIDQLLESEKAQEPEQGGT